MAAFEYWYSLSKDHYNIAIYIARDLDVEYMKEGKITEFQMSFDKKFRGNVIRNFHKDNALIAGEWFRDEIGYGPAKEALNEMNVPRDCLVWRLGEKG